MGQREKFQWRTRNWGLAILALMTLLVAVLAFTPYRSEPTVAGGSTAFSDSLSSTKAEGEVAFTVVGDSITEADSPNLLGAVPGPASWVYYAESADADFVGGWAGPGATTDDMVRSFVPLPADVLVIVAGTNDSGLDIPFERVAENLTSIAESAGTDRVILSSIPPHEGQSESITRFNAELRQLAKREDWEWVDAAAELRDGSAYAEGLSADGVHPNPLGAERFGKALHSAIVAAS